MVAGVVLRVVVFPLEECRRWEGCMTEAFVMSRLSETGLGRLPDDFRCMRNVRSGERSESDGEQLVSSAKVST